MSVEQLLDFGLTREEIYTCDECETYQQFCERYGVKSASVLSKAKELDYE